MRTWRFMFSLACRPHRTFSTWELSNQSLGVSRFLSRGFPRQGLPGLVEEGGGGTPNVAKASDLVVGQNIAAARLTRQISGALHTERKASQERDACIHMEATSPGFRSVRALTERQRYSFPRQLRLPRVTHAPATEATASILG